MRCNDCINYKSCKLFGENIFGNQYEYNVEEMCHYFKDKSLFVELPVNLGTILYEPIGFLHSVYECKVSSLTQKADGSWKIRLTRNGSVFEITLASIGKTVFLTKEEAEIKLREVGE